MVNLIKKIFQKNIAAKIMTRARSKIVPKLLAKDYSSHASYNLNLVDQGFAPRKNDINDEALFQRIIDSYNRAKTVQAKSEDIYQVSNEWLPIYQSHMQEITEALMSRSVSKVSAIYNNYFREPCSVGLHGLPIDMAAHFFSGKIRTGDKKLFLNDFIHRYEVWKSTIGRSCENSALQSPDIGNPYGYFVEGQFIKVGADYLHYYATIISRLIRGRGRKVVMELGGGYGGMAYYLIRDNADVTYVDFDLPENLALTAFHLLSAFPDKKIALYGEIDLASANLEQYDIVLMPNFEISKIGSDGVDLAFNSYSLAEMSRETIDTYIYHFNRAAKKFIYHVNHTRDSLVSADEFKIDLNKFELAYRAPALWNMARNIDMDEFEYLYKNKKMSFEL